MLKIKNLNVIYSEGTELEKKAIDNISIDINDGDFITVIGSNGAGKTTLLNAILGLTTITSGNIFLNEENITNLQSYKRAKEIGIVFQNPLLGTAPNMTIMENLALASAKGKWKLFAKDANKHNEYFEYLKTIDIGLKNRLNQKVGLLSGGQRQALTLLMATKEEPKILLLDEHTAALDPKAQKVIMELTDKIVKEKNITTIMITHNIKDALTYGNRLIMMDQGKIIIDLNKEEKDKLTVDDVLKIFNYGLSDTQILNRE